MIEDGNHALLVGTVVGLLHTLDIEPLFDPDGNYTESILITRDSGEYLVTITKVK